jgi:hypothetical protein
MSSRAEHHADSSESRVRDAKAQLAAILRVRDCREWAISSKGLADAVGLKATTVRDCIPEIRREYNLPVVACSRGYYVITDPSQLEHELDRIQSEIQTRRERKQELTAAFNRNRVDRE